MTLNTESNMCKVPTAISLEQLQEDSVFIRLSNEPDWFLHFVNEKYLICKGVEGAAVFTKSNANKLIAATGANNLEVVNVKAFILSYSNPYSEYSIESKKCNQSCSPGDYSSGGKCDKNGCFH